MAGNCGICGDPFENNTESVKCSGSCESHFHLTCLPVMEGKTRGSKKDYLCEKCKKDKSKATSSHGSSKSVTGTTITKEFLVNMMEAFKNEVFGELKAYSKEFSEIKKSMTFFSEKLDETNKLLEVTNNNYKEVKKEVEELKQKNSELTLEIKEIKVRLRHMEQYSRKCNVEISGVPVTNREDAVTVVEDVGKAIGVTLRREEVAAAHRVPTFRTGKAPSIVVQFTTRTTRDQWIAKAKVKRDLTADAINRSFPKTRVFIGEHLTPETKILLSRAKDKCKALGWKFVWCREGKVYVRKEEGAKCVRVDSQDDLVKLG